MVLLKWNFLLLARIVVMEKFTNLLFLLLTLFTLNLYNLYTLIYGVPLSFNRLVVLTTVFTLLMLTSNFLRFILLRYKLDAFQVFLNFKTQDELQFDFKIKAIQTY